MKSILILFVLALLTLVAIVPGEAQQTSTVVSKAYARNQNDTVSTPSNVALFGQIDVYVYAVDSINVKIYVETKPKNSSTWTVKDSVSYNSVSGANAIWTLRQPTINLIPGLQIDVRFRPVFAATINTLIAKSYSMVVGYTR